MREAKIDSSSMSVSITKKNSKAEATHAVVRFLCLLSSATALSFMVTADQWATISVYGFDLPLHSKWSFSDSFEYLVGISAAVAAHSLLQLVLSIAKLLMKKKNKKKGKPSRSRHWIIFVGDQVFAYAMLSAGSASAGVTNMNRMGIRQSVPLPNLCKRLTRFCDRAMVSLALAFFSCFLLAVSALLDVISLSNY